MKKNYTIVMLLFVGSLFVNAQPVLNQSDFENELSGILYSGSATGLSPGNAGANQVWNFSGLTLTPANVTFGTVAVETAYLANIFTSSNYCWKFTETNNNSSNYRFFSRSNSSLEFVGFSLTGVAPGVVDNRKFTDSEIIFQFPYTYEKVINDTFQYPQTTIYDAYGTLITSIGTYANVIRVKKTEVRAGGDYITYLWYQTNPFSPIMEGRFTDDGYITVIKNTTGLGVNQIQNKKSIVVFPNPTCSELNLQLPDQLTLDSVSITDITGKLVWKKDKDLNQINVSNLANGLYFIEAYSGKEKFQTKFIKN